MGNQCQLVVDDTTGILPGFTASGSATYSNNTTIALPDGAVVVGTPTNGTVTISSALGTVTPGTITAIAPLFRNTAELACVSAMPACSNGDTLSSNTARSIDLIELGDDDLHNTTTIDAAYNPTGTAGGGMAGLQSLLKWMYFEQPQSHRIHLGIVVGSPISYTVTNGQPTCNATVQSSAVAGLVGGSAIQEDIENIVTNLGTALSNIHINQASNSLTIELDLDEPLNHAYYSYVGSSGTGGVNGGACSISDLASLGAYILREYQQDWNTLPKSLNLPPATFLVGGDEAPGKVYNSPTFQSGLDIQQFVDDFHMVAQGLMVTEPDGTTKNLATAQQYYNFLLLDIGPTENGWKNAANAIFSQLAGSSVCTAQCPTPGAIFATLYGGPRAMTCPKQAYWQDNSFCANDAAAIAAAQAKTEDYLTTAASNPVLAPGIIRVSSYDKTVPSHLLPDSDPSSLTSFVVWLSSLLGQSTLPNAPATIFKLSKGSQHIFLTGTPMVRPMLNAGWTAEYPVGEAYQASVIGPNITLPELDRYHCNAGLPNETDYLTVGGAPPQGATCGSKIKLGYASATDQCTLGKAMPNNPCPNVSDIPVYEFTNTSSGGTIYYYTIIPNDIFSSGGTWHETANPVFYVQPNWPIYQSEEPIAFQAGLRTASGGPPIGLGSGWPSIGWQGYQGSTSVFQFGISASSGVFSPLICPGSYQNYCGNGGSSPTCTLVPTKFPGINCASLAGGNIGQLPIGDPMGSVPMSCCNASDGSGVLDSVGLEPIINFFPLSPFFSVYSNDNTPAKLSP